MIMRAATVPKVGDWHEAGGEGAHAFFPDDLLEAPDLVLGQSRKRTSSVTVKTTTMTVTRATMASDTSRTISSQ
jgi:hypothetical protein